MVEVGIRPHLSMSHYTFYIMGLTLLSSYDNVLMVYGWLETQANISEVARKSILVFALRNFVIFVIVF